MTYISNINKYGLSSQIAGSKEENRLHKNWYLPAEHDEKCKKEVKL